MSSELPKREVALQAENRLILLKALRVLGVQQIKIRYGGKLNRCTHCLLSTTPADKLSLLLTQMVLQYLSTENLTSVMPQHLSLHKALKDFVRHWLTLHHPHWTRDDGGSGVMTIDVHTRTFTLEHDVYLTENCCYRLKD